MKAAIVGTVAALFLALLGFTVLPGMFAVPMMTAAILSQGLSSSTERSTSCDLPAMSSSTEANTAVKVSGLTAAQIDKAHIVWQVAHELGMGDHAAVVGIVTLAQESTYGADPKTKTPDNNVDVADFQQRALPGWYASGKTVAENVTILSDTAYAARVFFEGYKVTKEDVAAARANGTQAAGPAGYVTPGLKQVKGWETMAVTKAAQSVQRSAFPGHYAKHEAAARQLVQRFNSEGAPPSTAVMTENPALCDPPGVAPGKSLSCPDSGLAEEQGLTPDATRALRCVNQQWPGLTYGGVREDSMPYHPSGRAIDIMIPGVCAPKGQEIADWARENAEKLGVDHIIWCQKIWSVGRAKEGWRGMGDRGSNTANHKDHVHITVFGNSAGSDPVPGPATGAAAEQGLSGDVTVAPLEGYTLGAWHGKAGSVWSSGFHTGLDLGGAVSGKPIKAVQAGKVSQRTWHSAYGNLTVIDHGGGITSWYAHAATTSRQVGDQVGPGDVLGTVGCTGNCFGDHLHLEIREGSKGGAGGKPVDPDAWLSARGVPLKGSRV